MRLLVRVAAADPTAGAASIWGRVPSLAGDVVGAVAAGTAATTNPGNTPTAGCGAAAKSTGGANQIPAPSQNS